MVTKQETVEWKLESVFLPSETFSIWDKVGNLLDFY